MAPVEEIDDPDAGIWTFHQPLSVLGAEIGCRMTVVRLGGGKLLLHSPIRLTPALRRRLDALGPVRYVLAPNRDHHLFVAAYRAAYPQARLVAAPGVAAAARDVRFDLELAYPAAVGGWDETVTQHYFRSSPTLQEIVLHHRATRTLIAADLAFNIQTANGFVSGLLLRLNDSYKTFGPSRVCRRYITAPDLARADVDALLALAPERIVVSHGEILHAGGTAALRRAYAWLAP
ncbi:MAG TPA: DUF4336 domain-containing protein [Candidatus Limnocylindria bacterium]|nr:DUF4336 domain-containing protein [Candidatus Limnocylindria bacterium]